MYLWKIEHLKQDLAQGGLPQHQTFLYILTMVVISALAVEVIDYFPSASRNIWDHVGSLVTVLLALLGTIWVYRANGGSQGRQFAERYFSIGLVVLIRFMALAVILVAAGAVLPLLAGIEDEATRWWETAVFSLWYLAYYWRQAKHTRDVAAAARHSPV
jgi:hypothetical protein